MLVSPRRRAEVVFPWLRNATVATHREDVLAEYVSRGTALDCGIVGGRPWMESTQRLEDCATSLHEHLRRINPGILGVDIDRQGIALLQDRGYRVRCENVEEMALGQQFDTIVAGELIEHLPNPGRALENLRNHLAPRGNLILSTCNPFYIKHHWNIWRHGDIRVHDEHTAWFEPRTLGRLLSMSGYTVERLVWLRKKNTLRTVRLWPALFRHYFHPNFLMVASPTL